MDDPDAAYENARQDYELVPEAGRWLTETVFEWSLEAFLESANAATNLISVEEQVEMHRSFTRRIAQKQTQFGDLLDDISDEQSYPPLE